MTMQSSCNPETLAIEGVEMVLASWCAGSTVAQDPVLRSGSCLVQCSVVIWKVLLFSFEEGALHVDFYVGPVNYTTASGSKS